MPPFQMHHMLKNSIRSTCRLRGVCLHSGPLSKLSPVQLVSDMPLSHARLGSNLNSLQVRRLLPIADGSFWPKHQPAFATYAFSFRAGQPGKLKDVGVCRLPSAFQAAAGSVYNPMTTQLGPKGALLCILSHRALNSHFKLPKCPGLQVDQSASGALNCS
jgi:hypothetical protein